MYADFVNVKTFKLVPSAGADLFANWFWKKMHASSVPNMAFICKTYGAVLPWWPVGFQAFKSANSPKDGDHVLPDFFFSVFLVAPADGFWNSKFLLLSSTLAESGFSRRPRVIGGKSYHIIICLMQSGVPMHEGVFYFSFSFFVVKKKSIDIGVSIEKKKGEKSEKKWK